MPLFSTPENTCVIHNVKYNNSWKRGSPILTIRNPNAPVHHLLHQAFLECKEQSWKIVFMKKYMLQIIYSQNSVQQTTIHWICSPYMCSRICYLLPSRKHMTFCTLFEFSLNLCSFLHVLGFLKQKWDTFTHFHSNNIPKEY